MQAVRITQTALQELDPSPLAVTRNRLDKESVEDSTTFTSRRLAIHRSKRKCWGSSARIAWLPPASSQLDPHWALRANMHRDPQLMGHSSTLLQYIFSDLDETCSWALKNLVAYNMIIFVLILLILHGGLPGEGFFTGKRDTTPTTHKSMMIWGNHSEPSFYVGSTKLDPFCFVLFCSFFSPLRVQEGL